MFISRLSNEWLNIQKDVVISESRALDVKKLLQFRFGQTSISLIHQKKQSHARQN